MEEIFKAYDIRGIYPEELNEELAYRIGREAKTVFPEGPVGVSRDMRKAAPAIKESLIRGMREAGTDIVDLGLLSTCMHYFAVGRYGYRGGIQVTASHNPPEYIGMKFVGEEAAGFLRRRRNPAAWPSRREPGKITGNGSGP